MRNVKNIAASVRKKLLNQSSATHRPFMEFLQYYGMERFLYRLSQSKHSNRFILKGALMLKVWCSAESMETRPTMDIDMLGKTSNNIENIAALIRDILATEVEPDGLEFRTETIQTESITENAEYQGIRVKFRGNLDTVMLAIQLDIGFGDAVYPKPTLAKMPPSLDFPVAKLQGYSQESVIAEKLHAMALHGNLNSRMKDFYDIWLLSQHFDFSGSILSEAVRQTFKTRETALNISISALVVPKNFAKDRQKIWVPFQKKLLKQNFTVPENFIDILVPICDFLKPMTDALAVGKEWVANWKHGEQKWVL